MEDIGYEKIGRETDRQKQSGRNRKVETMPITRNNNFKCTRDTVGKTEKPTNNQRIQTQTDREKNRHTDID